MPLEALTSAPRWWGSTARIRAQLRQVAESLAPGASRVIPAPDGSAYLTRFTLARFADGGRLYLHHFHQSDPDQELHNHPWAGRSLILLGGYREERLEGDRVVERVFTRGDVSFIAPDTCHRVELLDVDCWTLFVTGPAVQPWGFLCRDTGAFVPKSEFLARRCGGGRA